MEDINLGAAFAVRSRLVLPRFEPPSYLGAAFAVRSGLVPPRFEPPRYIIVTVRSGSSTPVTAVRLRFFGSGPVVKLW